MTGYVGRCAIAPDFDGNSGAPISDPARFCWNRNTRRAGGRRSGGGVEGRPAYLTVARGDHFGEAICG
jgi:hypothetical protein